MILNYFRAKIGHLSGTVQRQTYILVENKFYNRWNMISQQSWLWICDICLDFPTKLNMNLYLSWWIDSWKVLNSDLIWLNLFPTSQTTVTNQQLKRPPPSTAFKPKPEYILTNQNFVTVFLFYRKIYFSAACNIWGNFPMRDFEGKRGKSCLGYWGKDLNLFIN